MTIEFSPDKRRSTMKRSTMGGLASPGLNRESIVSSNKGGLGSSKMSIGPSSGGRAAFLDLHKKTGVELRESPSKGAKIVMKYINSYYDVGPQIV